MSKKIPVLNSPWGRDYERFHDCQRWIKQGHADMIAGALSFTDVFVKSVQRDSLEFDPTGFDDGILRRWAKCKSNNQPVKQLRPIKEVGLGRHVTKRRDMLMRRTKHGIVLHIQQFK